MQGYAYRSCALVSLEKYLKGPPNTATETAKKVETLRKNLQLSA